MTLDPWGAKGLMDLARIAFRHRCCNSRKSHRIHQRVNTSDPCNHAVSPGAIFGTIISPGPLARPYSLCQRGPLCQRGQLHIEFSSRRKVMGSDEQFDADPFNPDESVDVQGGHAASCERRSLGTGGGAGWCWCDSLIENQIRAWTDPIISLN